MNNREELIDAAEAAIDNVHDMDVTHRQYAEAATDAIIAAIVTGIPNLVWDSRPNGKDSFCNSVLGTYSVANVHGSWMWFLVTVYDDEAETIKEYAAGNNEKSTKAAANAHHRETIVKAAGLMV